MSSKPKSKIEMIADDADKRAKAPKKHVAPAPQHQPVCPACHQPLPSDAGPAPQGPGQDGSF